MNQPMCINHPHLPADPNLPHDEPPLCAEECAPSAVLATELAHLAETGHRSRIGQGDDALVYRTPINNDPDSPCTGDRPTVDESRASDGGESLCDPAETARLVREVQHNRRVLADIAQAAGMPPSPGGRSGWEVANTVRRVLSRVTADALYWEEVAEDTTARATHAEHRLNEVTGRQGNEIGQLRKQVRQLHTALDQAKAESRNTMPTQVEVTSWLDRVIGKRPVTEQALVLAEEVGELCRAVVKRAQGIRGTREQWTREIRWELADIHLALLALAEHEGIDLAAATTEHWHTVTRRDATAERPPAQAA